MDIQHTLATCFNKGIDVQGSTFGTFLLSSSTIFIFCFTIQSSKISKLAPSVLDKLEIRIWIVKEEIKLQKRIKKFHSLAPFTQTVRVTIWFKNNSRNLERHCIHILAVYIYYIGREKQNCTSFLLVEIRLFIKYSWWDSCFVVLLFCKSVPCTDAIV